MRRFALVLCVLVAHPVAITFAEQHSLIVLSQDDRTVYDLNPATGQVLKQCQLAAAPREAIFSWDEKTLFVSVPDAGHVAMLDVATFKEKGRIEHAQFRRSAGEVVGFPRGLATTFDGKLYIGAEGGLVVYDSRLLVLSPEWKQPGTTIAVTPKDGQYFKIQGPTDKLYYPHRRDNQVVVIDTKTDTVVKTVPVQGGPTDVLPVPGDEIWVQAADGSIAVIDSSRDEVKTVIATGGKGPGRITIAPDIRYIAATHSDSGDTTILHPLEKKVVATVKTGNAPSMPAFAPAAKRIQTYLMKDPTNELYVTHAGDSDIAVVNLETMKVASRNKAGKGLVGSLIHYTYPEGFGPPREGTARRLRETDLFTVRANAMFLYDVSPVHEHRQDMIGVWTGTGIAKIGCWAPECSNVEPERWALGNLRFGELPYINAESPVGVVGGISRGAIHQEEGGSPSPRRFILFDLKSNYYRQLNPKPSVLGNAGLRKIAENPRAVGWDITLWPGDKPLALPDADLAVVYLGGGLLRIVRDGKPEIVSRFFNEWDWMPGGFTVESLTDPVRMVFVEFK